MAPLPNLVPASGTSLVPGAWRPLNIVAPAAGGVFTFTVEGGILAKVLTAFCTFTTSAAVANRVPGITIQDPDGFTVYGDAGGAVVAASTAARFAFGTAVPQGVSAQGNRLTAPLPDLFLPAGYRIVADVAAIDAADQFSVVRGVLLEVDPSAFFPAGGLDEWLPAGHSRREAPYAP